MKRIRGRKGRIAKWCGFFACVLIVGAWVASRWCYVRWTPGTRWTRVTLSCWSGRIELGISRWPEDLVARIKDKPDLIARLEQTWQDQPVWLAGYEPNPEFHRWFWWFGRLHLSHNETWFVPLWAILPAVAAPTWFLWRRDRRFRFGPGRCVKCGYPRLGLAEGAACPECGEPAVSVASE